MKRFDELPVEIQEKMLEHQQEQGNPKNPEAFRSYIGASFSEGGFDWLITPLNHSGWSDILRDNNYDKFYQMYPKKIPRPAKTNQTASKEFNSAGYPKQMFVSDCEDFDDDEDEDVMDVLFEYDNKYWTCHKASSAIMYGYIYAKEIPKIELTVNEAKALIARLKNINIEHIKII